MEVIFKLDEDILVTSIKGEVDHHSAAPLRKAIDRSMKVYKCNNLILDFSHVEFMDSSGIGVALGRYKKLAKTNGKIYISGCSEHVEKLLNMADVFSLIPKTDEVSSAIDEIKGQEQLRMEVL